MVRVVKLDGPKIVIDKGFNHARFQRYVCYTPEFTKWMNDNKEQYTEYFDDFDDENPMALVFETEEDALLFILQFK